MILVLCTFGVGIGCFNLGVELSVREDLMALEIYSILRTVEYLHMSFDVALDNWLQQNTKLPSSDMNGPRIELNSSTLSCLDSSIRIFVLFEARLCHSPWQLYKYGSVRHI